jgi:protein phosphatase
MPVTFATATHTGLVRQGNEDSFFARPPVFAVADGMGGAQAGEVASGMVTSALEGFDSTGSDPADDLAQLVKTVNAGIFQQAVHDTHKAGMGTTLTAAVATEGSVDFVHVGDSRAYLWRSGELKQLTEDHSLVGEMLRQGKISTDEAKIHPQRSIITRALGVEGTVELDRIDLELAPGDLVLLCSDGLYSMVSDSDIASMLEGAVELSATAGSLVEAANSAGGADNITVVLFSPDGSLPTGASGAPPHVTGNTPGGEPAGDTGGNGEQQDTGGNRTSSPWWRRWQLWATAIIVLLVAVLSATWYMTRQIYYLDTNGGQLAIYQGVPLDIGPLSLSGVYRESNISFEELVPFEQERISRRELKSLEEAETILENYIELYGDENSGAAGQESPGTDSAGSGTTTGTEL